MSDKQQTLVKEALIDRREKVWEMRVVQRMTYRAIAAALGVSVFAVHQDAKWITKHKVAALLEKDKSVVAKQNEIYEALLNKWVPVAVDPKEEKEVSLYATDRIARILVDQAKLHGFHDNSRLPSSEAIGKEIGYHVMEVMSRIARGEIKPVIEAEIIQPQLEDAKRD